MVQPTSLSLLLLLTPLIHAVGPVVCLFCMPASLNSPHHWVTKHARQPALGNLAYTKVGSAGHHHSLTASSAGRQSIIFSHLKHRKPSLDRIPSLTKIHVYSSHILDTSFGLALYLLFTPASFICPRHQVQTSLGKIKLCTPRSCSVASSLTTASSLGSLPIVLPLLPIIGNRISTTYLS